MEFGVSGLMKVTWRMWVILDWRAMADQIKVCLTL